MKTDARVVQLIPGAAVLADGDRVNGDAFVVALPPAESARVLDEPDPELGKSPIVSVHLWFDRPLLRFPLAALLDSPAHALDSFLDNSQADACAGMLISVQAGE